MESDLSIRSQPQHSSSRQKSEALQACKHTWHASKMKHQTVIATKALDAICMQGNDMHGIMHQWSSALPAPGPRRHACLAMQSMGLGRKKPYHHGTSASHFHTHLEQRYPGTSGKYEPGRVKRRVNSSKSVWAPIRRAPWGNCLPSTEGYLLQYMAV